MPWSAPFLAAAGEGNTGLTPAARMPTPSSTARDGERVKRFEETLQEALKDLTPKERLAVLMKYRDGLPQKQIARIQDNTSKTRLSILFYAIIGNAVMLGRQNLRLVEACNKLFGEAVAEQEDDLD